MGRAEEILMCTPCRSPTALHLEDASRMIIVVKLLGYVELFHNGARVAKASTLSSAEKEALRSLSC